MRRKIWPLAVVLSLLPILVHAQGSSDKLIEELYVKSGLEKQVIQLSPTIAANFDQSLENDKSSNRMPKNIASAIRASVMVAFAPERLKQDLLPELTANLAAGEIKTVMVWLDSPLGVKFTQLEEAASTPEASDAMMKYAAEVQNSPQMKSRMDILKKFDFVMRCTEMAVEGAIQTQAATLYAVISTKPREQQPPFDEILRQIEKNRLQVEAIVRPRVVAYLLYAYRDQSENDLKKYIEFGMSPAGSKFNSVINAAMKKALISGSIRWGKAIGEFIKHAGDQSNA